MNKKTLFGIAFCIALLLCGMVYFHSMPLSSSVSRTDSFIVQVNEFSVQNGEPSIDSASYDDLTKEQSYEILDLLRNYSYRRTWNTYFSDGSMENVGNRVVSIYVYRGETLNETIYVSDSGQVSINDRLYQMKHAEQFNEQLKTILKGEA